MKTTITAAVLAFAVYSANAAEKPAVNGLLSAVQTEDAQQAVGLIPAVGAPVSQAGTDYFPFQRNFEYRYRAILRTKGGINTGHMTMWTFNGTDPNALSVRIMLAFTDNIMQYDGVYLKKNDGLYFKKYKPGSVETASETKILGYPVETGAQWPYNKGTASIKAVGTQETVNDIVFYNCVKVQAFDNAGALSADMTFADGAGLIKAVYSEEDVTLTYLLKSASQRP